MSNDKSKSNDKYPYNNEDNVGSLGTDKVKKDKANANSNEKKEPKSNKGNK